MSWLGSLFLQFKKPSLPASNSKFMGHVIKERMDYGPIDSNLHEKG